MSLVAQAGGNPFNTFQAPYPGTSQSKAYTGTAGVIDNAVGAGVTCVQVVCTTAAYIAVGSAPTAAAGNWYVPANTPVLIMVKSGDKVSAVQVSSGGTLYVNECAAS